MQPRQLLTTALLWLAAIPAAAAPPTIEGPSRGDPGQELRLTVAGIEGPDLTKATLADLAAWLKSLAVTIDSPAGATASIDAEITLSLGASTVRPRLAFRADRPGDYVVVLLDGSRPNRDGLATKRLTIGPPPPPPKPDNPPDPPEPKPDPPPITAAGFRVLIVYEQSADLPKEQQAILSGATVREYLAAHCVKDARGRPSFRVYDQNANLAADDALWREAMALPRARLPWLIVSNGTTGYAGPLPADPAQTVALLQRYAQP